MNEPFLAHSELTDSIYIIDKNGKYEVTEQCIKAMKATGRMLDVKEWLSSFNTESAPVCFNKIQELKGIVGAGTEKIPSGVYKGHITS